MMPTDPIDAQLREWFPGEEPLISARDVELAGYNLAAILKAQP